MCVCAQRMRWCVCVCMCVRTILKHTPAAHYLSGNFWTSGFEPEPVNHPNLLISQQIKLKQRRRSPSAGCEHWAFRTEQQKHDVVSLLFCWRTEIWYTNDTLECTGPTISPWRTGGAVCSAGVNTRSGSMLVVWFAVFHLERGADLETSDLTLFIRASLEVRRSPRLPACNKSNQRGVAFPRHSRPALLDSFLPLSLHCQCFLSSFHGQFDGWRCLHLSLPDQYSPSLLLSVFQQSPSIHPSSSSLFLTSACKKRIWPPVSSWSSFVLLQHFTPDSLHLCMIDPPPLHTPICNG